jgi:hypothetical protein
MSPVTTKAATTNKLMVAMRPGEKFLVSGEAADESLSTGDFLGESTTGVLGDTVGGCSETLVGGASNNVGTAPFEGEAVKGSNTGARDGDEVTSARLDDGALVL